MLLDNKLACARRRRARRDRGIPRRRGSQLHRACATARTCCRSPPARTTSACATATRARTPAAWAPIRRRRSSRPNVHARVMREIILPTVRGMAKDGIPYTGFLYAGLMIDAHGAAEDARVQLPHGRPRDAADHDAPEVRPVRRDAEHATDGTLDQVELQWDRRAALGVVMAAAGYPRRRRARATRSPACRPRRDDARGVPCRHGAAGRRASSPPAAACCASPRSATRVQGGAAARLRGRRSGIRFDGAQYRRDIGHRAIAREALPWQHA